jgi:hypothetical protein
MDLSVKLASSVKITDPGTPFNGSPEEVLRKPDAKGPAEGPYACR